ncbi:hypothetical protein C2E21_5954 [Chlorella sorokiniana]|uniref:Uncharacterized protein n=1 Tax=Chlorella sorokiniana TaxID=3076 RepID=A0A2P6TMI0_CHLSO|nr:hypothetical protein C2E21_5954 [Chlorella sorokiniana]|eukprot:PRW45540.1 hypothetical protein C2E21_5954 [Chlorella sorokiniana]
MNRKWRTNPGAIDTVASYPAFRASIPPRDSEYDLSTATDLYAVYTVLHIESKQAELRWSPHGRFYYFLAQWWQASKAGEGPAAAPEGDEDPPPQIVPEGSEAALRLEAEAAAAKQQQQQQGRKRGKGADGSRQQPPQPAEPQQQQQQQQDGQQTPGSEQQADQQQAGEQAAQAAAPPAAAVEQQGAAAEAGAAGEAASEEPDQPRLRTQVVVPVSSAYGQLTPALLQRLFSVRGVQAQQLLLALVDSNGVVTRSCLYNYIQAPLEGPGTANLELLDD